MTDKSMKSEKVKRYERKFFIEGVNIRQIENMIKHLPSFFREIHHERWVNNIYFDRIEFNNFMDNINGNMYRQKFRIRWYGEMFKRIKKPILECKIKKGLLGDKKNYELDSFIMTKSIDTSTIENLIQNSKIDPFIKFQLNDQSPLMLNRYKRKYFESIDGKFRITIDSDQSFYKLSRFQNNFLINYQDNNNVILEIKYDNKYDAEASKISNNFPFRLTKSSKYSRGIENLYYS